MIKRCCFKTVEVPILGQQQLSEVSDKDEDERPDSGHWRIKMYTPRLRATMMMIFDCHAFMKTRFYKMSCLLDFMNEFCMLHASLFTMSKKMYFINCMLTKP